ncbi:MAG: hypothetical protein NZ870_03435, partial [bacterium]|nr:hypothetical protein [bacterium]
YSYNLITSQILRHTNSIAGNFHIFFNNDKAYSTIYYNQSKNIYEIKLSTYDVSFSTNYTYFDFEYSKPIDEAAKSKFSTDFYFPFLVYSTQEGLLFAHAWLFSDTLSNHSIQNAISLQTNIGFLQYSFLYSFKKFRPTINFAFDGIRGYETFSNYKTFDRQVLFVEYPLTRFSSLTFGISNKIETESLYNKYRIRNGVFGSFEVSTLTGRYLHILSGSSFLFFVERSFDVFDVYHINLVMDYKKYTQLSKDSTFVKRLFYYSSTGKEPVFLNPFGFGLIRGYNTLKYSKHILLTNFEFRFPIKYFEYNTTFLFPDFYFKGMYGGIFLDFGCKWSNEAEFERLKKGISIIDLNPAYGFALRLPVFLLQSFYMNFTFEWAKNFYYDNLEFYFSLYPAFIIK